MCRRRQGEDGGALAPDGGGRRIAGWASGHLDIGQRQAESDKRHQHLGTARQIPNLLGFRPGPHRRGQGPGQLCTFGAKQEAAKEESSGAMGVREMLPAGTPRRT